MLRNFKKNYKLVNFDQKRLLNAFYIIKDSLKTNLSKCDEIY